MDTPAGKTCSSSQCIWVACTLRAVCKHAHLCAYHATDSDCMRRPTAQWVYASELLKGLCGSSSGGGAGTGPPVKLLHLCGERQHHDLDCAHFRHNRFPRAAAQRAYHHRSTSHPVKSERCINSSTQCAEVRHVPPSDALAVRFGRHSNPLLSQQSSSSATISVDTC